MNQHDPPDSPENPRVPRLRLRVTPAAENILRGGHPWLYADSVREQNREGRLGELAVVYDRYDRFLAIGLFDPQSPLRLRVLHVGKPVTLDSGWWKARLNAAVERRRGVLGPDTTGYRLLHGENDGWPGLVLDRYGDALVLKLYTSAWLPRLEEILKLIEAELKPQRLVLRLSRNIQPIAGRDFARSDGQDLLSPACGEPCRTASAAHGGAPAEFLETGIRFEADVVRGQKTGFFLDQRENRRRVETLAAGRDVLNAFSYTGGFSLYAARGGARSVTDLDQSAHALEAARRNFALNRADAAIAACRHDVIRADAFDWLAKNAAQNYDLVILDPPSLAKREAEREGAIQAYGRLAADGIRALRPGGTLVAASCSAHVSAQEFFEAVRGAARRSGRSFVEQGTTAHPPDHPATFPEAHYLKCVTIAFS